MNANSLQSLKLPELRARCKLLGLTGYSRLNKAQLIARLESSGKATATPAASSTDKAAPKAAAKPSSAPRPAPPAVPTAQPPPTRPNAPVAPPSLHEPSHLPNPIAAIKALRKAAPLVAPVAGPLPTVAKAVTQNPPVPAHPTPPPARPMKRVEAPTTATKPSKQHKAAVAPAHRKAKPVVLARTRPIASSLSKPIASPIIVPHRQPGQSNASFLDSHFTVRILRSLRAELAAPASRIMLDTLITGAEEPFTVALRFYIARLHTTLQMGGGEAWSVEAGSLGLLSPDIAKWPVITSCKPVAGDVWSIDTDNNYSYLCVGPTGEVIHRRKTSETTTPRADWVAYLASPTPLINSVRSKDSNEFPRGVFRGFQGKDEERQTAERVVLSSCVLQSFSGQAMPLIAMEAEWLGQASEMPRRKVDKVELFLPESHQLLSAHLTPHPSVGIVQRNGGYSEYVLRETGQIIGDEDGIVPLWQGMLACDHRGNHQDDPSFWTGWEARCRGDA